MDNIDVFELRVTRPDGRQLSASHAVSKDEQRYMRPTTIGAVLRINDETIVLPQRVLRGMLKLLEDAQ